MSLPKSEVFSIAKAFNNIENAAKLLEDVATSGHAHMSAKNLLKGYANKCRWIIKDLMTTLPADSAAIMREQVCTWETLSFESVHEEMLHMSPEQRVVFEDVAKAFRKGEIEVLKVAE